MTDILIEELHGHLYLKSPYCSERWKPYAHMDGTGASLNGNSMPSVLPAGKAVYQFLEKLDLSVPMAEDASRNPEADSFYYIQLLIESLNKMGHLDQAVDSVEQRLPIELFRVVDKTNNEVANRHPDTIRNTSRRPKENVGFGLGDKEARRAIISDLLWTLYSKFEAIAEGHRVLHDVIQGIVKRQKDLNATALTGGFKELWKLYQSEVRHPALDKSSLNASNATDVTDRFDHCCTTISRQMAAALLAIGSLSLPGIVAYSSVSSETGPRQAARRMRLLRSQLTEMQKMFKLTDIDHKSIEMSTEQDDLESILKSSVPGLVSDSHRMRTASAEESSQQPDNSATGHRLLVEPSVFNMGLLLPPSLSFIKKLKEIVPPESVQPSSMNVEMILVDYLLLREQWNPTRG